MGNQRLIVLMLEASWGKAYKSIFHPAIPFLCGSALFLPVL
jgi:hypothetical protein